MISVLFAAPARDWTEYRDVLPAALARAGIEANLSRDLPPENVDYIVYAPTGWLTDFSPYTGCKAVLSRWAGVERIAGKASLTMPLARMVRIVSIRILTPIGSRA